LTTKFLNDNEGEHLLTRLNNAAEQSPKQSEEEEEFPFSTAVEGTQKETDRQLRNVGSLQLTPCAILAKKKCVGEQWMAMLIRSPAANRGHALEELINQIGLRR